jgi:hypothetical protein
LFASLLLLEHFDDELRGAEEDSRTVPYTAQEILQARCLTLHGKAGGGTMTLAEKMKINHFYTTQLLPCVAGKKRWQPSMYHTTFSGNGVKIPKKWAGKPVCTISDEAFTILCYDNCIDRRFKEWAEPKKVPAPKVYRNKGSKKKHEEEEKQRQLAKLTKENGSDDEDEAESKDESEESTLGPYIETDTEATDGGTSDAADKKKKRRTGKYTNQFIGGARGEGWSPEGMRVFNELLVAIAQERKRDSQQDYKCEKKILQYCRLVDEIEAKEKKAEEERKARSRKKHEVVKAPTVTLVVDDEEFLQRLDSESVDISTIWAAVTPASPGDLSVATGTFTGL